MQKQSTRPTSADFCRALAYDPVTGALTWRKTNSIAGHVRKHGDHTTGFWGRSYVTTHIIWCMVTGDWPAGEVVDHKNLNRSDNSWDNLREATHSQNHANKALRRDNSTGFKGVTQPRNSKKWKAVITHQGRIHYLGVHASPELAHAAYCKAAQRLFGEFARFE